MKALLTCSLLAACGGGDAEGPAIILGPAGATTFDDLIVTLPDGNEDKYEFAWTLDEEVVEDLAGQMTVPADRTAKGQDWSVTVTRGKVSSTASLTIGNVAPRATVSLEPPSPFAVDDVVATGVGDDVDGDPTLIEYSWQRFNDESQKWEKSGTTSRTLPAQATRRGQLWKVVVTANDGDVYGPPSELEFRIVNAPPTITAVNVSSLAVGTSESIIATASAVDLDGDSIEIEYRWKVNGTVVGDGERLLDGVTDFDAGDELWAEARGTDGTATGPWRASAVVQVVNSPPTAPGIVVEPEAPFADEDIVCSVTIDGESTDPDGDKVSYSASWIVDGAPFTGGSSTTVPGDTVVAALTGPDETWTCVMRATDPDGAWSETQATVVTDARSGCADGTTEVEWNTTTEGCAAAAKATWDTMVTDSATICAAGWEMADSTIVNSVLNGPGYTDDVRYAFNGDGCDGSDRFTTTKDSSRQTRKNCVWRTGHYTMVGEEDEVDGVVCVKSPEE